jgi:hypothetical protein
MFLGLKVGGEIGSPHESILNTQKIVKQPIQLEKVFEINCIHPSPYIQYSPKLTNNAVLSS